MYHSEMLPSFGAKRRSQITHIPRVTCVSVEPRSTGACLELRQSCTKTRWSYPVPIPR